MAQFEDLMILVKSLSKTEKRYFKMHAMLQEGEKAYLDLFQLLENVDIPIEAKERFRKLRANASLEITSKHLYKIIMRSLRSYESEKTIESKLSNLLTDVRILFNKGLHSLCLGEIQRGKSLALKHEKFLFYLLLARAELQYLTILEFRNTNEQELLTKQEKVNEILYQELFINKHSSLYELISHRYFHYGFSRSGSEQSKLNDLVLEEFQVNANQHYRSLRSEKLHLHFQSTYFLITGSHEQSLQEFYQLHNLFESNPEQIGDDPLYYVYLLNGILTILRFMQKHEEMNRFMDKLSYIPYSSESLATLQKNLIFYFKLSINIDRGEFEACKPIINHFQQENKTKIPVQFTVAASTYLQMSIVYFGLNNFHESLKYLNKALALPEKEISYHIVVLCKLITLLVHLELGNDDHLGYAIRSLERKLKTTHKSFRMETVTIEFLKNWIKVPNEKRGGVLQNYQKQMKDIRDNQYEMQLMLLFPFLSWTEAKIKKHQSAPD